ncbi:MAG TPA: YigZ family protein [Bacteroidales bacterium]|nr:YigZ family protein [Bacteroidales bacterium]HPU47293.1 YigZ family protein [Bacteroidales bacterium]HPZ35606.1 YigZ family protein [Bacteroidales bacterium]HQD34859.1 YigZ family protein [Bacteroidales bacterium]HXK91642.1 YigZ family protein [Bacteroidales bacterium]
MLDEYKTIKYKSESIYKDRSSKFIGIILPVENIEVVKKHLQEIKKEYYDATHHCYAYILGINKEVQFDSDAGEPVGSAGKPILNTLLSYEITNTLAVVIRYYGGTKLGIPGLINAYKTATQLAIENNEIITKYIFDQLLVFVPYEKQQLFYKLQKKYNIEYEVKSSDNSGQEIEVKIRQRLKEKVKEEFEGLGLNVMG